MININDITFGYRRTKIFKNLSFKFNSEDKGKFIAIIGPNGCGKTTLLNILTGELKPQIGSVLYNGKSISSYSIKGISKIFAVVRQKTNIEFPFKCFDIVMMGRNPYRDRMSEYSNKDIDIVLEAMKKTDTYKLLNFLITEVSGGEYQRIMIARALAQSPEILFLDEAFSAMDIKYKVKILKLLKEIAKEKGMTIFSIMHDLNLAYKFSDKVCIISKGNIVKYGNTKDVLQKDIVKDIFKVDVELIEERGFFII